MKPGNNPWPNSQPLPIDPELLKQMEQRAFKMAAERYAEMYQAYKGNMAADVFSGPEDIEIAELERRYRL